MPLTLNQTREKLAALGHNPRKLLGQNFLVDANIVRKSISMAEVSKTDTVVEVGPGLGTLSTALLEAGAEVWAVEHDSALAQHLRATLVKEAGGRFHLLEADAMDQPIAGLSQDDRVPAFKIVANLPYAISTPWLDAVLQGPLPDRMVLMLQLEAAQRYMASPGSKQFGAISIFLQSAFELLPGHKVPRTCFHPRPDVDSYLLHVARRPKPFLFAVSKRELIRSCFQQRRKQIGAILGRKRDFPSDIQPDWRPEQLGMEDFIRLADWFREG